MRGLSLRQIPDGRPGAGIKIARLHYSADPGMTPERVAQLRSQYTSDSRWKREMEIEYEALEGQLLYQEWNRELNVCPAFDVSDIDAWTIYMGCMSTRVYLSLKEKVLGPSWGTLSVRPEQPKPN